MNKSFKQLIFIIFISMMVGRCCAHSSIGTYTFEDYSTGKQVSIYGGFSIPIGMTVKGESIKGLSVDSYGMPYYTNGKDGNVYSYDTDTGKKTTVAYLSGIREFEIASDAIFGMTESALYKVTDTATTQICLLDGFNDIAVSPQGRIIAYKSSQDMGLFEIDPFTGTQTKISSFVCSSDFFFDGQAHSLQTDSGDELILTDLSASFSEICFDGDGLLWLNNHNEKIYSLDLDNLQSITALEYLTDGLGQPELSPVTYDYYNVNSYEFPGSVLYNPFDVFVTPEPASAIILVLGTIFIKSRANRLK